MTCEDLKSVSAEKLHEQGRIRERIELETPQVVYIVECHECHGTHSIEFTLDDEPELLASLYKDGGGWGSTGILGAIAFLALLLPVGAHAQHVEITTACTCSAFEDANGRSIQEPLLTQAPLINGTRISSAYGMRRHPILAYLVMHWGVDFAAPSGSPIYAAMDGVVEEARDKDELGNYVRLRHSDTLATGYAHASHFAAGIYSGAHVRRGQVIAYVGSTGLSTGPHLHFEIFVRGLPVNPLCGCVPQSPNQTHTRHATKQVLMSEKAPLAGRDRTVSESKRAQKEGL